MKRLLAAHHRVGLSIGGGWYAGLPHTCQTPAKRRSEDLLNGCCFTHAQPDALRLIATLGGVWITGLLLSPGDPNRA